jgi:citrate lyase subunit beta/citryl-CoA lyase
MAIRPRRSVLYMPGSNARAIEKAKTLPADGVIIDLEDAVAPDAKVAARKQMADAVKAGGFGNREVFIRVNGIDTEWHADDLHDAGRAAPDGIVVPKVSSPGQLEQIGRRLLDMSIDHKTRIWAMIETPIAILNVRDIAAAAEDSETRLAGFILGTNDLAKETGAKFVPGRAPMLPWLATCISILDGVYNDLSNADGFLRECEQGRDLGFDGKTLIHPNQVGPCNDVFSPGAEEIAQARKIIAAFDQPENKGKGVVSLDGRMVERMHADIARKTVAIADAIAGSG